MDVLSLPFGKIYGMLVAKAERKGRSRDEVDKALIWLTGCTEADIRKAEEQGTGYGDFFRNAPEPNPARLLVKGKVCSVAVEAVEDPLWRDVRIFDLLVDRLAKGRRLEDLLPSL